MTMSDWAKREINIACKKENPNWDGKEFDYGCACYQSALKAYESLLGDGHSGMSWGLTKNILIRLMENKPLTPINDEDFFIEEPKVYDSVEYLKERGLKSDIQCPRMSNLFRYEWLDGHISYSDNDRVVFFDKDTNDWWSSGFATRTIDEMFPITMPYVPPTTPYKVYGDCNKLDYVITPSGERIELNITKK